jgi:hypothetical protein
MLIRLVAFPLTITLLLCSRRFWYVLWVCWRREIGGVLSLCGIVIAASWGIIQLTVLLTGPIGGDKGVLISLHDGRQYYVNSHTGDDANDCAVATPCTSISRAIDCATSQCGFAASVRVSTPPTVTICTPVEDEDDTCESEAEYSLQDVVTAASRLRVEIPPPVVICTTADNCEHRDRLHLYVDGNNVRHIVQLDGEGNLIYESKGLDE